MNVDHSQEKVDGKKSAIAETIAMMTKMKMEDKERKDAARQREEKRREMNPDEFSNPGFYHLIVFYVFKLCSRKKYKTIVIRNSYQIVL